MARVIMIQGTASGVGKTIITMALCRIFKQDGYSVSPFKSQNMTTGTALTKDGAEIAVSQLLQARAAGAEPGADMNPVILKLSPDKQGTQVILNGKYYAATDGYNFKTMKQELIPEIMKAYSRLSAQYDIVVVEGAGSPVELNLNKDDIVNMGIAKRIGAPVLLVADVDRGGIFASLYGTLKLLGKDEKNYVKAIIVNRFKGDASYFKEGAEILEKITECPVAGIVPYIAFDIPEEDIVYNASSSFYLPGINYDEQFDLIAEHVRKALNMELIYEILNGGNDDACE